MEYIVSSKVANHLTIGKWVEIFEASTEEPWKTSIHVHAMRVEGKVLICGKKCPSRQTTKALLPHEDEVIYVEQRPKETLFRIHLDS